MKRVLAVFSICFVFLLWGNIAFALPVDLSTFSAEPNDPLIVDIGLDTITFYEDENYGGIYAANDNLVVPSDATELTFDYSLTPGPNDYDWLVTIIEYIYEMEIGQSGSGSYSIDMTPYQSQTISVAFGLEYDGESDLGYDSFGTISNIDLATAGTSVPDASIMLLVGPSLIVLVFGRKKILNIS